WIVPGLCTSREDHHNVMRGEETQLLGARLLAPAAVYVMPGTHCKWVKTDGRRIEDFRTVMTGELHHLLLTHSLIGAGLPEQQAAPAAFHAGLARGLAAPAVLPQLFETRAAHLLGALAREQVSEYLSGLLIGAEVASMRAFIADEQAIAIVAGPSLSARYQQAFQLLGRQVTTVSGDDAFLAGIRSIVHAVANLTSADRYSARHHP
ncbi:TPA: 2-dehydro-3-deoxygalactonokinase, partial [Klebsiella variicola]